MNAPKNFVRRKSPFKGAIGTLKQHWASVILVLGLLVLTGTQPFFTELVRSVDAATGSVLTIGNYRLIALRHHRRFHFDYFYKATVKNSGTATANEVNAVIRTAPSNVTVIDGGLSFGDIPAGASVVSRDTFTIRKRILFAFNPNNLVWTIGQANLAPTANAGPDQTVALQALVRLDGSASSDPNGDPLRYQWALTTKPTGSTAELSDPAAVDPSFTADKSGTYVASLTVHDGTVSSTVDSVNISTINSAPIANAGADQTVRVGVAITLDGGASTDADGDPLTYAWSITSRPSGSTATLEGATAPIPTLTPDKPGIYSVELTVNDGSADSDPDIVILTTENTPPVADAGPDRSTLVNSEVMLDGSGSTDVDGDPLIYSWSLLTKPAESSTTLVSSDVRPRLTIDKPGTYIAQLIVRDAVSDSLPDTVKITTENSTPLADAGPDQSVRVNTRVTLDGSGSTDADGDPLTYDWSLITYPGSAPALDNPTTANPSFEIEQAGTYVAQLIVHDGKLASAPATVTITTENSAPVANAGADQSVFVDTVVILDGSGSTDADGDALTYAWALLSQPDGSTIALDPTPNTSPTRSFTPIVAGEYIAQLTVNDGILDSTPDTAIITVQVPVPPPPPNRVPVITSIPATTSTAGSPYGYDVDANDPDSGDVLSYALVIFPSDMTIDSTTGLITWIPVTAGSFDVTVEVSDGRGGVATQSFAIEVAAAQIAVPDVVGLSETQARTNITDTGLVVGTVTQTNSDTVPAGIVISQIPAASTQVTAGSSVDLIISLGPADEVDLPPDPATVAPPNDPTVATTVFDSTSFLYTGDNPIQTGVVEGAIDPMRSAVIRGRVLDKQNNPLLGATITILHHPEFGQTLSRADGMFDLAVNGGGLLTVNYAKSGYISAQRQADTPWRDYVVLNDVVLVGFDPQVTAVDLSADTPMQVARGSVQTDADGSRQATLLFPRGTQAEMIMPDGSRIPVSTMSVRATEFTVGDNGPETMPADLPATSAYTYAVDISVDEARAAGAEDVVFSQPIPFYVENFLNFPIGIAAPLGVYDAKKGAWVASDNGRVIKILSVSDGLAELDTDGDGTVDDGAALGITLAERRQLASLYSPGQGLWRVSIPHFSKWDINWGLAPPADAVASSADPEPEELLNSCQSETTGGSIIECQNQILGETLGVVGTPFSLHYQSERVPGWKVNLEIPLTNGFPPASLKQIELEILVAGRRFELSFPKPLPGFPNIWNSPYIFQWDGKDAYGRTLQGPQPITVRTGYTYPLVYAKSDGASKSFGYNGNGIPITGNPARREVTLWHIWNGKTGEWDARGIGLGGWSLSAHHSYDPKTRVVHRGDGGRQIAQVGSTISTFAGNGGGCTLTSGNGIPAIQAALCSPQGLATGPDGSVYIVEAANRVRRVDPNGIITTVAGTGQPCASVPCGEGGPATQARLGPVREIAIGPDNSLYLSEFKVQRPIVRRIGPDGIITTFAGSGAGSASTCDFSGPATQVAFNVNLKLAAGPDGSVFIADVDNLCIRRVGTDGIINTVAGPGTQGTSGDGGPATQASLGFVGGIAVGREGSLYLSVPSGHRIRRVTPDGIIRTIAGTGGTGFSGDGGPATQARFSFPTVIAVDPYDTVYIVDQGNNRVRWLRPGAAINTLAGNGGTGTFDDGSAARSVPLDNLFYGLAVGPDGNVYVAQPNRQRVRRITPVLEALVADGLAVPSTDGGEVYIFGANGRHLRTLDGLTGALRYRFAYDGGRLTSVTDGDGNITTIERGGAGAPTAIVGPYGQRTVLRLNADGYLDQVSSPAGETVQISYTADGLLTGLTSPRGHQSSYAFDALGRLTRATDAGGATKTLARTGTNTDYTVTLTSALGRATTYRVENLSTKDRRLTTVDPAGLQTQTIYKQDGTESLTLPDGTTVNTTLGPDPRWGLQAPIARSVTVTTPGGKVHTTTRQRTVTLAQPGAVLNLSTLTDTVNVNGRVSRSAYDGASRVLTQTSPAGRQTRTTLDTLGRPVQAEISGLAPTRFTYDTRGRLASATQGTGGNIRTTSLVYGVAGFLDRVTDTLGRTGAFIRDANGRITELTLPDAEQARFTYDASGNMTTIVPPGRTDHVFTYTERDLPAAYAAPVVDSENSQTGFSYNAEQRPIHIDRPDGQSVGFRYDSAGRVDRFGPSSDQRSYSYDALGRLVGLNTSQGFELAYAYDDGLIIGTSWSGPIAGRVAGAYDNDFRITSQSVNGSNTIAIQYDADSFPIQVGRISLSRDAQNGLITATTLDAIQDANTYDGFGAPSSYTASHNGNPVYAVAYTRDALGRISQKSDTLGGITRVFVYTYDLAGRLSEVRQDGVPTVSYVYDANGNRLSRTDGLVTTSASYDAQDRLIQYGATTYAHNPNGERLSSTIDGRTTSYAYDGLGNLTGIALSNGTQVEYLIDGASRRVGKKINGTLVQGFLYQDGLRPVAELDGSGTLVSRFIYADRFNVPAYLLKNGVTYRIISDQLGSPRLVIDATTGQVVQRIDYSEFGKVILDTNPGFQPFGFAGGLYDSDTNLVLFGARNYDAETGQWTTKDPIGFDGGANLYNYVANNPVNFIDPRGNNPVDPFGSTGAGPPPSSDTPVSINDAGKIADAKANNARIDNWVKGQRQAFRNSIIYENGYNGSFFRANELPFGTNEIEGEIGGRFRVNLKMSCPVPVQVPQAPRPPRPVPLVPLTPAQLVQGGAGWRGLAYGLASVGLELAVVLEPWVLLTVTADVLTGGELLQPLDVEYLQGLAESGFFDD